MLKKILNVARPFVLLAGIALLFVAVLHIINGVTRDKEPQPAPDITGIAYDGTSYALSEQFNVTPTVLVFFDPAEKKSTDLIKDLLKAAEDRAEVLAVSVSESPMEEQKTVIDTLALEGARILFDRDRKTAETYGLRGVPTTYFIDKDGMIHDAHLNGISAKTIEKALDKIA